MSSSVNDLEWLDKFKERIFKKYMLMTKECINCHERIDKDLDKCPKCGKNVKN